MQSVGFVTFPPSNLMRVAFTSFCWLLLPALTGVVSLCGCNKAPPPITKRTYTIPTAIVQQQAEKAQVDKNLEIARKQYEEFQARGTKESTRMLAAIVPQPNTDFFWTFKVQGPPQDLEKIKPALVKLLGSLAWKTEKPELPEWQIPEDWRVEKQAEDKFGRMATIELPAELEYHEIAVAKFTNTGDWPQALLANVNRWRGQLKLEPLSTDRIDATLEKVSFTGGEALLMDKAGMTQAMPGMTPPARKTPSPSPEPSAPEPSTTENKAPPSAAEARNLLTYDVPDGWQAKQASAFRVASFDVTADDKKADVSLSVFSAKTPEMGKLLPNVNRWRGELSLPPTTESELPEQTSEMKLEAGPATIFNATGTRQDAPASTVAAMIVRGDLVWFVKLQGDATLVSKQRPAFEEFLKSLKFKE